MRKCRVGNTCMPISRHGVITSPVNLACQPHSLRRSHSCSLRNAREQCSEHCTPAACNAMLLLPNPKTFALPERISDNRLVAGFEALKTAGFIPDIHRARGPNTNLYVG